jgi:hypothetical protein
MNLNSKTLREFSLRVVGPRKVLYVIHFGYDMSAKNSGYYLSASINEKSFSSSQETLKRVRSLGIPAINALIDSIGTGVTGTHEGFEDAIQGIIDGSFTGSVEQLFRIESKEEQDALVAFGQDLASASTPKQKKSIISKYVSARRVALLTKTRDTVRDVHALFITGHIDATNQVIMPKYEGQLKKDFYPLYYKRDIDYIRKARVKLFTKVLKRKYIAA